MDATTHDSLEPAGTTAADSEILFTEMLDRVKEVAHGIDERVHHALDLGTDAGVR
jgi:hypothetical protein